MPRDIDVVGVWHGTPYQVASVSSTADGVIVACGPAGRHTTYPKGGHRPTKDPSSGTSTWNERRSEEHTSELQSPCNLVCRLLLEKKKNKKSERSNLREIHER